MGQAFTDRETLAGVLALLVRERSIAGGSSKTSRTGLQASVPVSERADVRRGLDALLELGLLAMSGEDIGFTSKGKVFLAHVQRAHGQTPSAYEHDEKSAPLLAAILAAIEEDQRFVPDRSIDDVRTLPARLQDYRVAQQQRFSKGWFVVGGLAAAAATFALMR